MTALKTHDHEGTVDAPVVGTTGGTPTNPNIEVSENFEAGTNTANITYTGTPSTTYTNGNGESDGTMTFSSVQKAFGSLSMRVLNPTLGGNNLYRTVTARAITYRRFYFRLHVAPSGSTVIADIRSGSTTVANLQLSTTSLRMRNGTTVVGTFSSALSLDTWYRLEHYVNMTAGTQSARIYSGSNLNAAAGTYDQQITGAVSTGTHDRIYVGTSSAIATGFEAFWDSTATATVDWVGPYSDGSGSGGEGYDSTNGDTPTYVSGAVVGSTSIRFPGNNAVSYFNDALTLATNDILSVQTYVRLPVTLPTGVNVTVLVADVTGGSAIGSVQITPSGMRIRDSASTTVGSTSSALVVGAWYRLEWTVDGTNGTQWLRIWSDPASTADPDNTISGGCGPGLPNQLRVGSKNAISYSVDIDQTKTNKNEDFQAFDTPPTTSLLSHHHEAGSGTLTDATTEGYTSLVGAGPTYVTDAAAGTKSLSFTSVGSLRDVIDIGSDDLVVRMYVQCPVDPTGGNAFLTIRNSGGSTLGIARVSGTTQAFQLRTSGGVTVADYGKKIMVGAWYRVQYTKSGGVQTLDVWEDPASIGAATYSISGACVSSPVGMVDVGQGSAASTIYIDEVAVDTSPTGPESGTYPQQVFHYWDGSVMTQAKIASYWNGTANETINLAWLDGTGVITPPPPPPPPPPPDPDPTPDPNVTEVIRFRIHSPYEQQLPDNTPVNSDNTALLASLQYGYDSGDFSQNYNGKAYMGFTGANGYAQGGTGDFSVALYRVDTNTPNYHLQCATPAATMDRFKVGGEGIRIPAIAKTYYKTGATSSDSPMMIYDPYRNYYAWLAKVAWEPGATSSAGDADTSGRWYVSSGGGGWVMFMSSYGVDSNTSGTTTTSPAGSWPGTLSGSGRAPSYYQDNGENDGPRGCNTMVRQIDFNRLYAEQRLNYMVETFVWESSAGTYVWPFIGAETRGQYIPEGARLRIKSSIDVTAVLSSDTSQFGTTSGRSTVQLAALNEAIWIAKGLQKFGTVIGDNSGNDSRIKLESTYKEGRGQLWNLKQTALRTLPFQNSWEFLPYDYDAG